LGFPGGISGKEFSCQFRSHKTQGLDLWIGSPRSPWRRAWQPSAVFLPGDIGAWQATVHRVVKSQTRLKPEKATGKLEGLTHTHRLRVGIALLCL